MSGKFTEDHVEQACLDWVCETVTIGDFLSHRKGFAFKSTQYKTEGLKVARVSNFTQRSIDTDSCICIDEREVNQYSEYVLKVGDVVIATVGSWPTNPASVVGRAVRVPEEADGLLLNQNAVRLRSNEHIDQQFLYYLLSAEHYQNFIVSTAQGSASQASIKLKDIFAYQALIPPLSEQKAIASVLGALDDKIENNRRMNETLEEMARAIFKSWFVDFDPVHAKAAGAVPAHMDADTAALFPSSFGDDGLPAGWGIKKLEDVMELAYGKALKASNRVEGQVPVYGSGGITGSHNEALVDGPSVIIGRKGTVGSLFWEDRPFFPIDTSFYLKPKIDLTFCYYLLQTLKLDNMNTDAAVPGLNRNNVYRLEFTMPSQNCLSEFQKVVGLMRRKIRSNSDETQTLAELRDTLLPKLMSGEIRVADAESEVEAAV